MTTVVFPVAVGEGKTSQQVIDSLHQKLQFVGAVKSGSWQIDCEAFQSSPQSTDGVATVVFQMHNSEHAQLTFSIVENGPCMVSNNSFDLLMAKLKGFYMPRKGGKIELKGSKYEYGDFTVKIGTITQASSFKGITVEVKYNACFVPIECWELIHEFISLVIDKSITISNMPLTLVDKTLNRFCDADTMLQYLQIINLSKKT